MINTIKGEKLNLYTNSNLYVNELFVIFCLSLKFKKQCKQLPTTRKQNNKIVKKFS